MNPQAVRRDSKASIAICIGMGAFILIPIVRWILFETDHQFANIGAAVCLLVAMVAWATAYYRLANRFYRWVGLSSVIAVILPGLILFEYRGLTGELVPIFRWRFAAAPQAIHFSDTPSQNASDLPFAKEVATASFPQFLGGSRTGVIIAPALEMNWRERPPKQLWRLPVGAGWSGICVANGMVWTLFQDEDREAIVGVDLLTGREKIRRSFTGRHTEPLGGTGPRSTPTAYQGKIIFQTATGQAVCLDVGSGEVVWHHDLLLLGFEDQSKSESSIKWGRSGSPLIVPAIAAQIASTDPGDKNGSTDLVVFPLGGDAAHAEARTLIAFDLASGREVWRSGTHQISYSSPNLLPLAGRNQIVSVNEGTVSGHDPRTGTELWKEDWPNHSNADACSSQAVQIGEDQLLVSKGYGAGAKLFRLKQPGSSEVAPANWSVEPVWKNHRVLKTKLTSAVHVAGKLYGLSDGILECVDAASGERVWRKGRYGQGQCLVVNDHLLVTTEMGKLVLVRMSDGEELFEKQILDGICWNYPAVAGPFVLMRNGTEMVCFYAGNESLENSLTDEVAK